MVRFYNLKSESHRSNPEAQASSLYVHIPFCIKRCKYCDFNSMVFDSDLADQYIDAVEREIADRILNLKPFCNTDHQTMEGSFKTIYIGGGTPTVLNEDQLNRLLSVINNCINLEALIEYTIEANPGTLNHEKIKVLKDNRINRVSLGVQSFNDSYLKFLGRIHTSNDTFDAFSMLRGYGFTNINIDLIFGIPSQKLEEWGDDVKMAISLGTEHVSTYSLTYEKGTPLWRLLSQGAIKRSTEFDELRMYKLAIALLTKNSFKHYEISNFAKENKECIHNMTYWENQDYMGIGAGAFSFIDGRRESNEANVPAYVKKMLYPGSKTWDKRITFHEKLSPRAHASETLIMGLRLRRGISNDRFYRQTGYHLADLYSDQISRFVRAGLISFRNETLMLTKKGLYVADSVMMGFLD